MILPIIAYGDPVLRKVGKDINKDYPNLENFLENMKETMNNAKRCWIGSTSNWKGNSSFYSRYYSILVKMMNLTQKNRTFLTNLKKYL